LSLHLIVDNYAALARNPRFFMHFSETYVFFLLMASSISAIGSQ
jgi:hypothetical protein